VSGGLNETPYPQPQPPTPTPPHLLSPTTKGPPPGSNAQDVQAIWEEALPRWVAWLGGAGLRGVMSAGGWSVVHASRLSSTARGSLIHNPSTYPHTCTHTQPTATNSLWDYTHVVMNYLTGARCYLNCWGLGLRVEHVWGWG